MTSFNWKLGHERLWDWSKLSLPCKTKCESHGGNGDLGSLIKLIKHCLMHCLMHRGPYTPELFGSLLGCLYQPGSCRECSVPSGDSWFHTNIAEVNRILAGWWQPGWLSLQWSWWRDCLMGRSANTFLIPSDFMHPISFAMYYICFGPQLLDRHRECVG